MTKKTTLVKMLCSGTGSKVARINLTGDGWLDPSTVRIVYTLMNNESDAAKRLRPISGPWSFFRMVRCTASGAICDDIDYYNRVHEMLEILTSDPNRNNSEIEGFGLRWDNKEIYKQWAADKTPIVTGGKSRTVSFKPLSGILNQPKYIPLAYCPLTLELEVVTNPTDAIIGIGGSEFTATNTSIKWSIKDIRVVCDVVTLDSGLQHDYAQHVLPGKKFTN